MFLPTHTHSQLQSQLSASLNDQIRPPITWRNQQVRKVEIILVGKTDLIIRRRDRGYATKLGNTMFDNFVVCCIIVQNGLPSYGGNGQA